MPQIPITDGILPYLLYTPDNFDTQAEWPLIVLLHGSGERGSDLDLVRKWGIPKYLDAGNELPAIVISPQCPTDQRWSLMTDTVRAFIYKTLADHPVNLQRVYLTGFSMGGQGTWVVAVESPEMFAAVVPVAGRIPPQEDFLDNLCVLQDKPLWVFHGAKDEAVEIENSDTLVQTLRDCGATNLQYTRYPDAGHGEASDWTYSNAELYEWLFSI